MLFRKWLHASSLHFLQTTMFLPFYFTKNRDFSHRQQAQNANQKPCSRLAICSKTPCNLLQNAMLTRAKCNANSC